MLLNIKDKTEIIITINAKDIESSKIRGDNGISYDTEAIRLKSTLEDFGFLVSAIVITQYEEQEKAKNTLNTLIT